MNKKDDTDSILAYALKWNETNPIKYKGMWYPKGTLKIILELHKPEPQQSKKEQ